MWISHPSSLNLADNVAAQDPDSYSLRFKPSESDDVDFAKLLVEHGANVAAQDGHGSTPLDLALGNGHVELAQFLVEHGAVTTAHPTLQNNQPQPESVLIPGVISTTLLSWYNYCRVV
jgi:ankyrin repeat protein